MGLLTKNVLGIKITTSAKKDILEEIGKYLSASSYQRLASGKKKVQPLIIFTPNPEIISYAQKDPIFNQIVNSARINIPDGAGVCWAIKKLYGLSVGKISGADLMEELCFWASENGATIGLIGGREGIALNARECLRKKYPKLNGWAMDGPEIKVQSSKSKVQSVNSTIITLGVAESKQDTSEAGKAVKTPGRWPKDSFRVEGLGISKIISKIIQEKTAILFVAFGFPKQEYFIKAVSCQLTAISYNKPSVLMAVGGSFDYLAGRVPRAPSFLRERGLEWLYRLIKEPGRLPRQIKGAEFFWRVLWGK